MKTVKDLFNKSVMSVNKMGYDDIAIVRFDDSSALTLFLRNTMSHGQNGQVDIGAINGSTVTKAEENGTQILLTFDDDICVRADSRESTLI